MRLLRHDGMILCVVFFAFVCLTVGVARGAGEIRPLKPFPDERAAMTALEAQNTPANRAALAKIRFVHAGDLMEEFTRVREPGSMVWAMDYAQSATELDPSSAQYWFLAGYLYGQAPSHPEMAKRAEAALKKAIDLDPEYSDAMALLGMLYVRMARYRDALDPLEDAIKRQPRQADPMLFSALCQAYVFGKKTWRGEKFFKSLIDKRRQPDVVKIALATLWQQTGKTDKARSLLDEVIRDPKAQAGDREGARLLRKDI